MKKSLVKIILLIIATFINAIINVAGFVWGQVIYELFLNNIIFKSIYTIFSYIPLILFILGIFIPNEKDIKNEELKKQKVAVIILATIIFIINLIFSLIIGFTNYGDIYNVFENFQFSFLEIFASSQSIISYVLIVYVSVIKIANNYVEFNQNELLNIKLKHTKKINKWIIILIISCIPIVFLLMSGITGTEFLGGPVYGIGAIILNFYVFGIMYGLPITVLIIILTIISIIKIILYKIDNKKIDKILKNMTIKKMDIFK